MEDLRKAVEALTAVMSGRASRGSGGSGSGGGTSGSGARKTIGEMTNDQVVARMEAIHGRVARFFDASQVKRLGPEFDGRVDWRATNAAYRRAVDRETSGGFAQHYAQARRESHAAGVSVSAFTTMLPDAIARPVIAAFERNRGWRDLGEAFSGLARDAKDASKPFGALAGATASRLAVAASSAAVAASAIAAPLAVTTASVGMMTTVGNAQTQRMASLAPYDGRLLSEYVELEVARLGRQYRVAENASRTGRNMIGTRDMLESSLVEFRSAADVIRNQVGAMGLGGLAFGARMATNAVTNMLGGDAKDLDKMVAGINATNLMIGGGAYRAAGVGGLGETLFEFAKGVINPFGSMFGKALELAGLGGDAEARQQKMVAQIEKMEREAPEMLAAIQIPALLAGIAGTMGAFGEIGVAGFNAGYQKTVDQAAKQADQIAAEKTAAHSGWMAYFGGVADDKIANFNAHGPIWNVGPLGGGGDPPVAPPRGRGGRGGRRGRGR